MFLAQAVMSVAATLAALAPHSGAGRLLAPGTGSHVWTFYGLSVVFAIVMTALLLPPGRMARTWARSAAGDGKSPDSDRARREALRSACLSAAFVAALLAADHLVMNVNGTPLSISAICLLVAVLLDIAADFGSRRLADLVPVLSTVRPYEIEPARAILERAGILVRLQNAHWYGILPFYSGFAPVVLLAPATDAERARALLAEALGDEARAAQPGAA